MTKLIRHSTNALLAAVLIGLAACGNLDDPWLVEGPGIAAPDQEDDTQKEPFQLASYLVRFQIDGGKHPSVEVVEPDVAATGTIGTGTLIDMLLYAVYDGEGNLLPQYAKEEHAQVVIDGKTITAGEGQNIIPWNGEDRDIEINGLSDGEYRIVCWAQSSKCEAYDASNLKQVTVSYDGALNNDETRDAFCASEPFTITADGDNPGFTATLRRPLAQVNVATSGADYENNDHIVGGALYTYSAMTIKGVANTINVVDNVIGDAIDETVTFQLNKLPAYFGMDIPSKKADLITTAGEQWLQIHLNEDTVNDNDGDGFADFKAAYPTVEYTEDGTAIKHYLTETFKYMSMCYVLVPANNDGSATLDSFKATFADNATGDNAKTSLLLTTVPVKRNWRTNIIGGLYAPEDPQPPVDDPTTIFSTVRCNVMIITTYFDNYNIIK